MFQSIEIAGLGSLLLGQVPVEAPTSVPEATFIFSGPRFFVSLISGIVLAVAIQFVLTNLSVATGISMIGGSSDSHDHDHDHDNGDLGDTIRKIGFGVGIWTLVTVTIALFIACFLAVKLGFLGVEAAAFGVGSLGIIVALVIWAAYFVLLYWFSSRTVGSLVGSIVNTATSGLQAIVGTAAAALGAKAANDQVVNTAGAAAAAVRRELTAGIDIDPAGIRDRVEDYLDTLRPPQLDMPRIRSEFEKIINDPELQSIMSAGSPSAVIDRLRGVDRQTFVNLVSNRTDLSRQEVNRLVDQLQSVWHQVIDRLPRRQDSMAELVDYLKTARPESLNSNDLNSRLDQLIEELRRQNQMLTSSAASPNNKQEGNLFSRAVQLGFTSLMGSVVGRTDLSDLDVEKVVGQLQKVRDKVTDSAQQVAGQVAEKTPGLPYNTIRADVENYLLNAYSWHLNRETIKNEFQAVIYDPEADAGTVRRQLEQFDRAYFVELLTRRGDLPAIRVSEIADALEATRQDVLSSVRYADEQEQTQDLRSRVENYLRSTGREELNPEGIERDFAVLLQEPNVGYEQLQTRLSYFDRNTLVQLLSQRPDISPEEAERIVSNLESTRDRVLVNAQENQNRIQAEAQAVQDRVEGYLRNTRKEELNPEGIKRDFKLLLDDPQAGAEALRFRLSKFDRDTFVQLLAQRPDISQEEANHIVDQLEEVRYSVLHAPQMLVGSAKDQYDQTLAAIADYLRRTDRPELDPAGIQSDLLTLLNNPKEGSLALRRRLSMIDRETLVKLLSQRQDLSEEQINRTIDQLQEAIRGIVRTPRRFASRTKAQVQDFQSNVENYLLNTNKEELNPEGIKRDLQLLLHDPRVGVESLTDRLSRFDRSTIVALLSQRKDMTEEEANRVVDQVLGVRDQVFAQMQNIQNRIQSVIDSIFIRIRNYLNSLDRPELNYEGIKRDVRTLFYDPQAGFEALRDRLASFNRDTVVALLSSREDISEADANRIVNQIEDARTSVLRRAERIQQETQARLEAVKRQAQKQAEETRKAAATAAWWLFGTALTSAVGSALAGYLAISI
jgi:nucleoid DNA-binding protein